MMAPAARRRAAVVESRGTRAPLRSVEPAGVVLDGCVCLGLGVVPVVLSLSAVAMLFLRRIGIPWRGLYC